MNKSIFLAAALAGALLIGSAAHADTISIGLQEADVNGGALTAVASPSTTPTLCPISGDCAWAGSYGSVFSFSNISGMGNPPLSTPSVLDSSSMNTTSSGAGTLTVYVSETDISGPGLTGVPEFFSSFTENNLTGSITVTESTYVDPSNILYGTTATSGTAILLGSAAFPPLPVDQPVTQSLTADVGAGPYSLTAVYRIVANGAGQDNATIDVMVPEPASLTLLGTALVGLGWFGRRRKRV